MVEWLRVVDSHTGGEVTRLVIEGLPELRGSTIRDKARDFVERFDPIRTGLVQEPRGSGALVGAILLEASEPNWDYELFFFNDVGLLGMCGHGTIGVVETLRHLGRMKPGAVRFATPAGLVVARLGEDGQIELENRECFRFRSDLALEVDGVGPIVGDVAYGGNWFFVVKQPEFEISFERIPELEAVAWAIRRALQSRGITGERGAEIDHIELAGPSERCASRNFVLCPGGAYDRSPCGTGCSAKLACLLGDRALGFEERYVQESVTGSLFQIWAESRDERIVPHIQGRASVVAETTLLFHPDDPLRWGMR